MQRRLFVSTLLFLALTAAPALAGPPLICHAIPIGSAQSLPWHDTGGWNGMDPSYDTAHLMGDTLALLTPWVPTQVRMETLRRAVIYSSRAPGLTDRLSAQLAARALSGERDGKPQATAFFDAGYFAEAARQGARIYAMLRDPQERAAWQLRAYSPRIDTAGWIAKAIRLGGQQMEQAQAVVRASEQHF